MKSIFTFLFIASFTNVFAQADTVISKTIVDPTAMVAGSLGGNMQTAKFKAARKIDLMGVDSTAHVTSYSIYFKGKGFETAPGIAENVSGGFFTNDVLRFMERCRPGTTILIDVINVKWKKGIKRVPSLQFTLQ